MTKYQEFQERFKTMTDKQLAEAVKRESTINGWTNTRAEYMVALQEEVNNRKPRRILIPFSLTAEEALKAVKTHLRIGNLSDRQFNSDNLKEFQQNLEWLAKELKIPLQEMYLVDDFYRQWKIKPDQKITLGEVAKVIQAEWSNGKNTIQAIKDWEVQTNRKD